MFGVLGLKKREGRRSEEKERNEKKERKRSATEPRRSASLGPSLRKAKDRPAVSLPLSCHKNKFNIEKGQSSLTGISGPRHL